MEVIEKEIGHVIEIEENISMMQIPKVMEKNYSDIFKYLDGCDVKTNKYTMPYARYMNIDWERQVTRSGIGNFIDVFTKKWHFFTGVPSTIKLDDKDRFKSSKVGKRKYIKTIHCGP